MTKKYYSSSCQDYYADNLLKKTNGFFLDIGAGTDDGGMNSSNSYYFESIGWSGICLDADEDRLKSRGCKTKGIFLTSDNLSDQLEQLQCPSHVDYLSIDVDGLDYEILHQFLKTGRSFSFLTIEHDIGTLNPGRDEVKKNIFEILSQYGYLRIADNVCNRAMPNNLKLGYPFEDWYINPKFIDTRDFYNENR